MNDYQYNGDDLNRHSDRIQNSCIYKTLIPNSTTVAHFYKVKPFDASLALAEINQRLARHAAISRRAEDLLKKLSDILIARSQLAERLEFIRTQHK